MSKKHFNSVRIAAASAADAGIHKKILGSGKHPSDSALHNNTILIISNDEMKKNIKIVASLDNSSLLPEETSKTIQNEAKEQRWGFFSMLLGRSGASLLGDILTGKGINRAGKGHGQGIVHAGYGSNSQSKINKFSFSNSFIDEYWNKKVLSKWT